MTVRSTLVASLEAMDAAGTALRWARHLLPARHADARAWSTLTQLLDALDAAPTPDRDAAWPRGLLAIAGFQLLSRVGYALELSQCVVCGRPCPEAAPAFVEAARGGIVCRSCGGGGRLLDARSRELAIGAQRDETHVLAVPTWLTASQAKDLLAILSDAMAAHTGLDPSR